MAVSDSSPYWIIDQMIWNALEDTGLTNGAALDAWRKQQNPKGNAGTNYRTGFIPDSKEALDTPALYFSMGDITTPEAFFTKRSITRYYPIQIVGELKMQSHREAELDKLVKRFQNLVEKTIGEALTELAVSNSSYLPSGDLAHNLDEIFPGSPIFPDWTEPDALPIFVFPIFIQMTLSNDWLV